MRRGFFFGPVSGKKNKKKRNGIWVARRLKNKASPNKQRTSPDRTCRTTIDNDSAKQPTNADHHCTCRTNSAPNCHTRYTIVSSSEEHAKHQPPIFARRPQTRLSADATTIEKKTLKISRLIFSPPLANRRSKKRREQLRRVLVKNPNRVSQ